MTAVSQLRLLTLNLGENGEAKLYRLEKGICSYFSYSMLLCILMFFVINEANVLVAKNCL